ncbi:MULTISPECIES: DUF1190 domain-containing protein [unclassified Bosea (in: a-proteobacteria)]|uniref:DUF1190 domain-containing protein n=1 Tax=unclassified Bosea (in: a-proteobacteria) TaxID=2653178 RepID=UPI000F74DC28|nr:MULTISPECIES: DUF1190 domain-containing protein [unclassified Bosea (in: a-proteobacteria)]AZO77187.1 hypothetical protein BLM15_05870 [Bosea sp. Tri-49]RXT22039.1 hypothetical protein B5U98_16525 [Bosea sp. Tri-39]RXT32380.1 hypothetical protein B5U99_27370 [Bosea sp. Tri-54]
MKRSTQIGLAAAGVVLVATYWSLSGGETDDSLVYNNVAECRAANQLSASQCEQRFNEASANHLRDAKKFTTSASCEQEFGASGCQSATWNNAQVFIPALAGIMLARQFMSGGGAAQPLLPPTSSACPPGTRQPGSGRPECEQPTRTSSSSSSSGGYYGSSSSRSRAYTTTSGQAMVARNISSTGMASTPSVASRGGFGSTSRSFSSSSSS